VKTDWLQSAFNCVEFGSKDFVLLNYFAPRTSEFFDVESVPVRRKAHETL